MTLITIVTPTYERPGLLIDRALPSVLAQTHTEWEWLVVGDGATRGTVEAMSGVRDPRVRFVNRPRSVLPRDDMARWRALGAVPAAWGLAHARGEWLMCLGDDDALMPTCLERLLETATAQGAGAVYGRAEVVGHGLLGTWPVEYAHIQWAMWRRSLGFNVDPECWRRGLPADWDLWSRMLKAGVRWAFTPEVLYRYFPAHRVPQLDP